MFDIREPAIAIACDDVELILYALKYLNVALPLMPGDVILNIWPPLYTVNRSTTASTVHNTPSISNIAYSTNQSEYVFYMTMDLNELSYRVRRM